MSKILYCSRCSCKVGEIKKGKFKHTAVCLCDDCNTRLKLAEIVAKADIPKSNQKKPNSYENPYDLFGKGFSNMKEWFKK